MAKKSSFKKELNALISKWENDSNRGNQIRAKFVKRSISNFERSLTEMRDTSPNEIVAVVKTPNKATAVDKNCATLLMNLIWDNNPKAKKPNYDKWADVIRLIREVDGHTSENILSVIRWSQNDHFWHKVILSPDSLRKNYGKLTIAMNPKHVKEEKENKPGLASQLSSNVLNPHGE